jgi:hypothetical protein
MSDGLMAWPRGGCNPSLRRLETGTVFKFFSAGLEYTPFRSARPHNVRNLNKIENNV